VILGGSKPTLERRLTRTPWLNFAEKEIKHHGKEPEQTVVYEGYHGYRRKPMYVRGAVSGRVFRTSTTVTWNKKNAFDRS
jgi:hypothetical protein